MADWPATLPQHPDQDGYGEQPKSRVLSTTMDVGPPKTRLRTTAGTTAIPVQYTMNDAQLEQFEQFFELTIAYGSLPFNIPHPRTDAIVSVMIVGDPPYTLSGTDSEAYWRVSMKLEVQPA